MLEISRPKDSKHVTNVSNSFLHDLEACLVNLKLPLKLFICLDVLEELESSGKAGKVLGGFFVSSETVPKLLASMKVEDMG